MFWCQIDRELLLKYLPKRGIVAEVGTYNGAYAQAMIRACEPEKLFLIDKWDFSSVVGQAQFQNYPNQDGHAVLAGVRKAFAREIAAGNVQCVQADSVAAAAQLAPGSFDWVYIDCDHRYEAVLAD